MVLCFFMCYATVALHSMKKDIHPTTYRPVIFQDSSNGEMFLIGSTIATELTGTYTDGKEYPLFRIEISSTSHPFYTGDQKMIDTAGRAERFRQRARKAVASLTKTSKKDDSDTQPADEQ